VVPPTVQLAPPWNAQRVFEPILYPRLWWDVDSLLGRPPEDAPVTPPEDLPVRIRQQPGYEPVGVRAGSWMFYPSLTAGGFYDSNVFSSNIMKRADMALRVHPAMFARTLWDRHEVTLQADVWSDFYRNNPGLDQTNASIRQRGRIDVRHDIAILTNFIAASLNEGVGTLSSPAAAVKPTPYTLVSGDVTYWQQFNRLVASFGSRIDSYDYGSTVAQNGAVIDQSNRDGQIYVGHGRLDYALSGATFRPKLGVFTALDVNKRDIRGVPAQPLHSDGYRVLSGVNVEFTHLITGEFGIGYARQRFDAASIGTNEGLEYRAFITWSPTRLIDVKFKAEQIVTQASETDATGIRADALALGLDYEFRRNVILSVWGTYENDKFLNQQRRDNVYATFGEIKYLFNRFSSMAFRHKYIQRESNIPFFSYDKHEVGIYVTTQF